MFTTCVGMSGRRIATAPYRRREDILQDDCHRRFLETELPVMNDNFSITPPQSSLSISVGTVLSCCHSVLTTPCFGMVYRAKCELMVELLSRLCLLACHCLTSEHGISKQVLDVLNLSLKQYTLLQRQQANNNRLFMQVLTQLFEPCLRLRNALSSHVFDKDSSNGIHQLIKDIEGNIEVILQAGLFQAELLIIYKEQLLSDVGKLDKIEGSFKDCFTPVCSMLTKLEKIEFCEEDIQLSFLANSVPFLYKLFLDSYCRDGNETLCFQMLVRLLECLCGPFQVKDDHLNILIPVWPKAGMTGLDSMLNLAVSHNIYNIAEDNIRGKGNQYKFYRNLTQMLVRNPCIPSLPWFKCLKTLNTLNHLIVEPDLADILHACFDADISDMRIRKAQETLVVSLLQTYTKLRQFPKLFQKILSVIVIYRLQQVMKQIANGLILPSLTIVKNQDLEASDSCWLQKLCEVVLMLVYTWIEVNTVTALNCDKYVSQMCELALPLDSPLECWDFSIFFEDRECWQKVHTVCRQSNVPAMFYFGLLSIHRMKILLTRIHMPSESDRLTLQASASFFVNSSSNLLEHKDQKPYRGNMNAASVHCLPIAQWHFIVSNITLLLPYISLGDMNHIADFLLVTQLPGNGPSKLVDNDVTVDLKAISKGLLQSDSFSEMCILQCIFITRIINKCATLVMEKTVLHEILLLLSLKNSDWHENVISVYNKGATIGTSRVIDSCDDSVFVTNMKNVLELVSSVVEDMDEFVNFTDGEMNLLMDLAELICELNPDSLLPSDLCRCFFFLLLLANGPRCLQLVVFCRVSLSAAWRSKRYNVVISETSIWRLETYAVVSGRMSSSEEQRLGPPQGGIESEVSTHLFRLSSSSTAAEAEQEQHVQGRVARQQRVPEWDEDLIVNDILMSLVHERVPLWDTHIPQHSDNLTIRWLWNKVAKAMWDGWDNVPTLVGNAFSHGAALLTLVLERSFIKQPRTRPSYPAALRHGASDRSLMPEFLQLSSVFHDGLKAMGDRLDSAMNHMHTLIQDVTRSLD
ncbi:unnamed protein product [Ranitomeya imitator]|uniref:Uncharacterized protein n=1 Tax=Ranitomeya imitator TaxID=111125 RepID=A0ABN9KW15_9NEOB|nr:unnamed protein product [Ranitomeya imitator]